jgi:hypothetical protein
VRVDRPPADLESLFVLRTESQQGGMEGMSNPRRSKRSADLFTINKELLHRRHEDSVAVLIVILLAKSCDGTAICLVVMMSGRRHEL